MSHMQPVLLRSFVNFAAEVYSDKYPSFEFHGDFVKCQMLGLYNVANG